MKSFIKFTDCKTPNDILAFCQQNDAILENSNFRFNPITGKPSEDGVTYKELLGSPIPRDGDLEGLRFQAPLTYAFNPEDNSFDFGPVDWLVNNTGGVLLKLGYVRDHKSTGGGLLYNFQNMSHYEAFYGKVLAFGFVYIYDSVFLICGRIDPSSYGKYWADFFFVKYAPKELPNYGNSPLNKIQSYISRKGSAYRYEPAKDLDKITYLGSTKQAEFEACGGLFPASQGIPIMFREPVEIGSVGVALLDGPTVTAEEIYKEGFSNARVAYEVNTKTVLPIIGRISSGITVPFNNKH